MIVLLESLARKSSLNIVFEDEFCLVVNKPAGLLSVPGRGVDKADCLITRVQTHAPTALIVHRLDRDTSGLLIIAKDKTIHRDLSLAFMNRAVDKSYVALVDGHMQAEAGIVDLPLDVDWPNRPLHHVNYETGKPAQTEWQQISYDAERDCTRVSLKPITGRTHQLRIHMQSLGHSILGDTLYASAAAQAKSSRLCLHAELLSLAHPVTKERMQFECAAEF